MASRKFVRTLLCLAWLASGPARADWLSLVVISPKPPLDWTTPGTLAMSASSLPKNEFGSPIGHVNVELRCDAFEGRPAEYVITGMTNENDDQAVDLVLNQGLGLGILFYDLRGKLQDSEHITRKVVAPLRGTGRMSLMRFAINPSNCRRLLQFYREFQERGYDAHYGLPNRPRHGEGGGCSAFGVSFLDVAGLLENDWKRAWSRSLRVPEALIGEPGVKPISLLQIIISAHGKRWAQPFEPGRNLFLYDPALMREWVNRMWNLPADQLPKGMRRNEGDAEKFGGQVIDIDRRHVATPNEPLWIKPAA